MRIFNLNDAQHIKRFYSKMSEDDGKLNIFKLEDAKNFLDKQKSICVDVKTEPNLSYDHVYTANIENGEINPQEPNCQSAESEVKFWKDWIILHLDLIQQQNDEILNKERTILILQQENEMLKERLSCMERGAPFQPKKILNNHSSQENVVDNMTQDFNICNEEKKTCLDLISENGDVCVKNPLSDGESQSEMKANDQKFEVKLDSDQNDGVIKNCDTEYNFTVSNTSDLDSRKNIRMSIKRKRLSNSSAVSNNDSALEEKRSYRKLKNRRKRLLNSQILTTSDHYITETNKLNLRIPITNDSDLPNSANLEVPRWRIKVYGSCYAMEGTENLDDEVFNKRHNRLEIDERRRKRWDVQRIREQRIVERLKQRQERIGSGSRTDEQNESTQSFLPNVDEIKFIEVSEELPVSAFGAPIPNLLPSEFILPWMNDPSMLVTKKVPLKKSSVKKKSAKR